MTFTKTVPVAAGVFAPGHLGELTWQVPFELADAVLEETRRRERRPRGLPPRGGIYFLVGLGAFPGPGHPKRVGEPAPAPGRQGGALPPAEAAPGVVRRPRR